MALILDGSNGVTFPAGGTGNPAGSVVGTSDSQSLTNKTIGSGYAGSTLTLGTAQASTSGTSIDFTSIPSWVKRITIMLSGVSTNGSSTLRIQIGSGSVNTTADYNFAGVTFSGTPISNLNTAGYDIETGSGNLTAASVRYGAITLLNITGNSWLLTYLAGYSGTTYSMSGAGNKSLSGILDRVRITTVNGTDAFDAGTINIMYE